MLKYANYGLLDRLIVTRRHTTYLGFAKSRTPTLRSSWAHRTKKVDCTRKLSLIERLLLGI
jgi:hypothetical protein